MTSTTVFIHDSAVRIRDPFVAGQVLRPCDIAVLHEICLSRLTQRIAAWAKRNPDASTEAIHVAALRIAAEVATMESPNASGEAGDPIYDEALQLARDEIMARLAAENLPEPTNLDLHAEELLSGYPELMVQARRRIEIRREVAAQALNVLELSA